MDHVFNLPNLTFWSASVRRRIHDNGIVGVATADLTFYKLHTIIYKPADRSIFQPGRYSILLCLGDHSLGGINMSDRCTGSRGCEGSSSGIGKEIQYFDRSAGVADLF